eukprot:Gregarina_sp_Pseudo_9__2018@NODE_239_length_3463_cov_686_558119_g223_i0_p1_GENE_NODE_239_length_3463_cov_686_558119_g223_i0NODE_239_length_3463_cov_686_558119_g223_i0_p1_ORF_typecomplete_len538_score66_51Reprolysin_4/PF13583_6/0_00042Reprolysin_3/PF13582_6/1_2e04Reprolysin_3/PF13582_6/0_001Peptidase_M66/PF10462_9/0_0014Peptidase_M11/PF05548_11/0_0028Reprolysin_5/PF13688_6/6_7e02Reprolysin_5/PF13688_6/0_0027Reprolysin_5/PF13688_6/3_2e03Peptidase_M54/PF07998_11/0_072DUF1343/PF07075_11/0_2Peptidase
MRLAAFSCLLVGLTQGDFLASVAELFESQSVSDVEAWQARDSTIKALKVVKQEDRHTHQTASGFLLDTNGGFVGESYVLRSKESGKVLSVNLYPNGTGYILAQDTQWQRAASDVAVRELPAPRDFADTCGVKVPHARSGIIDKNDTFTIEDPTGEKDPQGNYLIDVVFIFSTKAKEVVENTLGMTLDEYGMLQQLIVETAWVNSGIEQLKLRVVDVEVWSEDVAVTEENALWVRDRTLTTLTNSGSDIVAYFTTGTEYGTSTASGFAGLESYYSLQFVDDLISWRHELGHNAGLGHCYEEDDGFAYKHGWNMQELGGTIMCGNTVSVYSNPDIVWDNKPAGDKNQADATRQWQDYKPLMSGYLKSKVPYDVLQPSFVLEGTMVYRTVGDNLIEWSVPKNIEKMVLRTFSGDLADGYNLYSVFVTSSCCEGVYQGNHRVSTVHLFAFDCPGEGLWRAYISGQGPTNFTISFFQSPESGPKESVVNQLYHVQGPSLSATPSTPTPEMASIEACNTSIELV